MSKALIIKGASFAQNAVEQITISNPVPCTGIALSKSTISFTGIGDTDTLTATLTPADTTEALTWASSDEDVATVENGIVTCVGIGTATITAYCGDQSTSCEVSLSSVTIVLGTEYSRAENTRLGGSVDISKGKTYCSTASFTYGSLFYSGINTLNGYKAFYAEEGDNRFCIPIPKGATQFTATPSDASMYLMTCFFDANEQASARPSSSATWSAKAVYAKNGSGTVSASIGDYPDANGFAVSCNHSSSTATEADLSATVTVTFS